MANNKFDIKVFTDELNKAFTILKKEQVLEKYMKNVLLNYNSIIYIGNITDELNKYNTIYNYMYGEDNTLCNIVVFETDGFVDSESNIIPSGIHIAYPYLDYSVCIDYKYILNINNSAELLTPTQEYKTINNESILGSGNIFVQEKLVSGSNIKTVNGQSLVGSGNVPVQEPLVSGINIKAVNEQSLVGGGSIYVQEKLVSGINIKTVNEQSLVGRGNIPVQEPLVSGTNIKTVNGQTILGSGNIEISGGGSSGLTFPTTSPTSQLIPSITTSNEQQNLTIGDGLVVDNGALKTIGTKYYEITITRNLFDYNGKTTDEKANYVSYATDYTLKFIIDETNYNALLNSISSQLGFTVDTEYLINNYNTLKQMPEYISGLIGGLKICAVGSISSIANSTSLAYINNCCYIAIPSIEGEDSWFKCTPGYFGTLCAYDADKKQMTKIGWDSVAENSTLTITTKYL